MGLFGNKREKNEKVDKYEYQHSSKGRSPYGPPAIAPTPPSPYLGGGGGGYFDGYGMPAKKYGKYGTGGGKSLYGGVDPMQQAMLLPPQSAAAMQAQAAAMLQMQQYMAGQGAGAQFGGILPPIQLPLGAAQQAGLIAPQAQQAFGGGYSTPGFGMDPASAALLQQQAAAQFAAQQQQGAFAPYQQLNFYDPQQQAAAGGFSPYGYMPAY